MWQFIVLKKKREALAKIVEDYVELVLFPSEKCLWNNLKEVTLLSDTTVILVMNLQYS